MFVLVDESPVEDLPQIMMTIASNQEFAFMTDYCSLTTWIYEPTESKFIPAIVPNRNVSNPFQWFLIKVDDADVFMFTLLFYVVMKRY